MGENSTRFDPQGAVIFEEDWARGRFEKSFPDAPFRLWSWDEWLSDAGEPEPPDHAARREDFARSLLAAPSPSGDWMSTLTQLREALIASPEDVEFSFSHLPATPKNLFLKKLFLLYLDSVLAPGDRAARTQRLIERMRAEPVRPLTFAYFVRSRTPSPAFEELARAHLKYCDARYIESWELPVSKGGRCFPAVCLSSESPSLVLDRFSEKIQHEVERRSGRTSDVQVLFHGTPASRSYLACRLASLGLRARFEDDPESPMDAATIPLFPLHAFPTPPGGVLLAYWEATEPPDNPLAFDAVERQRLRIAGFRLAESAPYRERTQQSLGAVFQRNQGHCFLFTRGDSGIRKTRTLISRICPRTAPCSDRIPEAIQPRSLSATSLETYAECPAQFAFAHLLRLRPQEDPESSFHLAFGKLVHAALEKAALEGSLKEEAALLRLFDVELDTHEGASAIPWLKTSLRRRFAPIATLVPRLENRLTELFGDFRTLRVEDDFEISAGSLSLRGRFDRLIELSDGSLVVIDYKTGTVDFSPEQIKKGKHFQAPVYLHAALARKQTAGVLFYDLKRGEVRRGVLREESVSPEAKSSMTRGHILARQKWDELLEESTRQIDALAKSIRAGDFAARPSASACEHCRFGVHCRQRYQWGAPT